MRNPFLLFIILFIYSAPIGFAQGTGVTVFQGVITSALSNEPVPYANIRVAGLATNAMSNESGRFIIKLPANRENDSIYISHIGYKPAAVFLNRDTNYRVIKLQTDIEALSEITVKSTNPLDLINKAIAAIPRNYPVLPYRLSGFYRLTGWKEKRVVDMSEAVFDIYSENYNNKNSQLKLTKSRLQKDLTAFNGNDNVEIGLTPKGIFGFDVVSNLKNSFILSDDALKNHDFSYRGVVHYNGQTAYKIVFKAKEEIKKSLYDGEMYIGTDDLAFLEFNTHLNPKGLSYYSWGLVQKMMMNMTHITVNMLSDSLVITYRKFGDRYFLNRVNNISRIYLAGGKNHFLLNPLVNKTNFLITQIDTLNVLPFQKSETLSDNDRIESRHFDNGTRFWENYNLILPDFNVDSVARIIETNNATLDYKQQLRRELSKYTKNETVRIDSIISFYYHKNQFNGSVLVQSEGKVIYNKGWGFADKKNGTLNSAETQFRIGSTSKQFTAMLVMQLVSQNKISVEDTVGKFIPGYRNGSVTIQQLLTHQSGIPNYTGNEYYLEKILKTIYTPDELVSQFCSDSLDFPSGTAFEYSNSNYVILADIIEKITHKSYGAVLTDRIFLPLGMRDSYFVNGQYGRQLAIGYLNGEPEYGYPVQNVIGAGGITSTATDLLIWANSLTTEKLIPASQINELFKPRVEWKEWDAYYGYGWMIDRSLFRVSKNHIVQYHPGTEFGFYDMLMLQRDKGIVIVLLNNTGDFPRFDMSDLILDQLN
jgi:CubicO group peptidase (beta-lactamase class C family)